MTKKEAFRLYYEYCAFGGYLFSVFREEDAEAITIYDENFDSWVGCWEEITANKTMSDAELKARSRLAYSLIENDDMTIADYMDSKVHLLVTKRVLNMKRRKLQALEKELERRRIL